MTADGEEDASHMKEAPEGAPLSPAPAPAPATGALRIGFLSVTVAPETEETGLWFRWSWPALAQAGGDDGGDGVDTAAVGSCSDIVESVTGALGFGAEAAGVPLTEAFLTALAAPEGGLVLEAFEGEYGHAEEDLLVGRADIDLTALLCCAGPRCATVHEVVFCDREVKLEGEEGEGEGKGEGEGEGEGKGEGKAAEGEDEKSSVAFLSLRVALEADEQLTAFIKGGRLFSAADVQLSRVPGTWTAEDASVSLELGGRLLVRGPLTALQTPVEGEGAGESAGEGEGEGKDDDGAEAETKKERGKYKDKDKDKSKGEGKANANAKAKAGSKGKGKGKKEEQSEEPEKSEEELEKERNTVYVWDPERSSSATVFLGEEAVSEMRAFQSLQVDLRLELPDDEGATLTATGRWATEALAETDCMSATLQGALTLPEPPAPEKTEAEENAEAGDGGEAEGKGDGDGDGEDVDEVEVEVEAGAPAKELACSLELSVRPAIVQSAPPPRQGLRAVRDYIAARPERAMRIAHGAEQLDTEVSAIAELVAREFEAAFESAPAGGAVLVAHSSLSIRSASKEEASKKALQLEEAAVADEEKALASLLHALNEGGQYASIRQRLKSAVSKFVSEDATLAAAGAGQPLEALYALVLSFMTRSLNRRVEAAKRRDVGDAPAGAAGDAGDVGAARMLLARAEDAEVAGRLEEADALLRERIGAAERGALLGAPMDASVWYDLAALCLRRGIDHRAVAAECLHSALAASDTHASSLAASAALLLETQQQQQQQQQQRDEDEDEDEDEAATAAGTGGATDEDGRIECFLEAAAGAAAGAPARSARARCGAAARGLLLLLGRRRAASQPTSAFVVARASGAEAESEAAAQLQLLGVAAEACLQWRLPRTAGRLLARAAALRAATGPRLSNAAAKLSRYNEDVCGGWAACLAGDEPGARERLARLDRPRSAAPLLLGDILFRSSDSEGQGKNDEEALAQMSAAAAALQAEKAANEESGEEGGEEGEEGDVGREMERAGSWGEVRVGAEYASAGLLRLGRSCLRRGDAAAAKELFLRQCAQRPSPASWLGVGESCVALAQHKQALDALSEANVLDRHDALVWANLALVCGRTGQARLATLSFQQAMQLDLAHKGTGGAGEQLVELLARDFLEQGKLEDASLAMQALPHANGDVATKLRKRLAALQNRPSGAEDSRVEC